MKKTADKRKVSLKATVEKLARIAEKHLSTMPEEEKEKRVALMSRRKLMSPFE